MNYVRHLFFVLVVVLLPPFALPFYLSPLHASPFALRISRFLPTRSRRVVAPPLTNPSTALYSEPDPSSLPARPASTSTPTTTTEPYKYVSSQGFEVERPRAPSAAAVRRLPRRLFITTVFLTLPLTFLSNFLELTSKLVISSPIPAVADFAASLNLNELYPDAEGYKIYKSPSHSSQPLPFTKKTFVRYSLLIPPRFVQDPAVALANSQLSDPNREMRIPRSPAKDTIPDVAWGPMGKIDTVTRKSSSDINLSVITTTLPPPFSLAKVMGNDTLEASQRIVSKLLCPPNSGKNGILLSASKQTRNRTDMYVIEYTIDFERTSQNKLRAISILAGVSDDTLVTYTAVGRDSDFPEALQRSAESFTIL